jgi:hypothetical protein
MQGRMRHINTKIWYKINFYPDTIQYTTSVKVKDFKLTVITPEIYRCVVEKYMHIKKLLMQQKYMNILK